MMPYLQIVLAMLIWSTWGLLIRWMALPAIVVLFYSSFIGGIAVPVVLAMKGGFPHNIFSLRAWPLFACLAVTSILNNVSYFYALGHTTISNAVFTHYTAPVIVAVLAPFLIEERIRRVTLFSLPVAVVGLVLIMFAGDGPRLSSVQLPGILAGTASGAAYALMIIVTRRLGQMLLHQKAIIILLWVTTLVTAPSAFAMDYSLNLRTLTLLFITGVMHSTMASLMYFSALRRVLAQHAAVLGYIEPLAAIPLAYLFLSEEPTIMALFGGALILMSGYLIVRSKWSDDRILPDKSY